MSAATSGRKPLSAPLPHAPSHSQSPHTVSKPQAAAQRATASQTHFSRKKKFLFPCQQASLRFVLHGGSSKCWFLHSALHRLHICPLAQADTNPHVSREQPHPLAQPATCLLSLSLSKFPIATESTGCSQTQHLATNMIRDLPEPSFTVSSLGTSPTEMTFTSFQYFFSSLAP